MSEYLRTGGLPVPLPDDAELLENMLRMQKVYDNAPEMVKPMERKLVRMTQGSGEKI